MATEDQCEESWERWKDSTRHVYRNRNWLEKHKREHESAVALCYTKRAQTESDFVQQKEWLLEAKKWDHNLAEYQAAAYPIAEEQHKKGEDLFALEDWQGAYDAFSLSVALQPSRSQTRKRAEEARDKRLNIIPPHKKEKKEQKKPKQLK